MTCKKCQQQFTIYPEDKEFYQRIDVPEPKECPDCRQQNRIIFRNFKTLYSRKSDLSGKTIISMYAPDSPYKVYSLDEWWSDKWDPMKYGREFDFSKPFFEQFHALNLAVPRFSIMNTKSENCQFSNFTYGSNNCYLIFGCTEDEDCYYGHIVWESKNCVDCLYVYKSEQCYECVDCLHSYNLQFCQECENCFDCRYSYDLAGCNNCFGCVGLRHASYQINNKQYSQEEYKKIIKTFDLTVVKNKIKALQEKIPKRYLSGFHNEDVSGDHLYYCANVKDSFDVKHSENCKYLYTLKALKDSYDVSFSIGGELIYNSLTCKGDSIICCHLCFDSFNMAYCDTCMNCQDCFGCSNLNKKKFCIFNKQYEEKEYKLLKEKIINHMKKRPSTGSGPSEWGNFFPIEFSPFAYNESIISEYYPLSKEEALKKGYRWHSAAQEISQNQSGGNACEQCGKPFKIIEQEKKFYQENNLPAPKKCFNCRHAARMALRNQRRLHDRKCQKCNRPIKTTYTSNQPEIIYCERCYNQEIY